MPEGFLVGHDVGTGGCKSVLIDLQGRLRATQFAPYPIHYPRAGWAEQDPEDYWRAAASNTRRLISASGVDRCQVRGIGFAGQMLGLVPLGSSGQPTHAAISWMDSRADEQATSMIRRLGGKQVFLWLAGAVPSGKDVVCKLAWIKEQEPAVFRKTAKFLDVTGYLVYRSTGSMVVDRTAAGGTGLLNPKTQTWDRLLARLIGVDLEKLPQIRSSIDIVGPSTAEATAELGLEPGTPVIAGMADIPAAATGSGALEHGDAHVYLGTSSWLCLSVSHPVNFAKFGIVSVASPDPNGFIMIGESETAGACLNWFAENLAHPDERAAAAGDQSIFQALDELADRVEPGAGRLLFMPWMFGERAPVPDTTLRAAFFNLDLKHSREHMLRAIYEGVAYNLRWLVDAAGTAGFACRPLRVIGGGARSDVWMQIIADITERPIETVENPQYAGAVGCALAVGLALEGRSDYRQLKQVVRVRKSFEPHLEHREEYGELYHTFRSLYPGFSRACHRLNRPVHSGARA